MSSRAAAGRKKLQDPSASSKSGFFSRSKSVAPPPTKDAQASYPSPPDRTVPLPQHESGINSAPPGSSEFPQNVNYPYENRHFSNGSIPHPQYGRDMNAYNDSQYGRTRTTTLPSPAPFHKPRLEEHYRPGGGVQQPTLDLSHRHPGAATGKDMNGVSRQQSYQPPALFDEQYSLSQAYQAAEGTFFEASYQPPPPVRTSSRAPSPRGLPSYHTSPSTSRPGTGEVLKSSQSYIHPGTSASPAPRSIDPSRPKRPTTRPLPIYSASSDPDFHFPPSSTNSPPNNSLLLQPARQFSQSSQQTELPAYASSSSISDVRPSLHVLTDREYQSQPDLGHEQNRSPYDYPSPPTSNPRYTPSPLRHHSSESPIISSLSLSPEISVVPRQLNVQPFPRGRGRGAASIISSSSGSSRHSDDSAASKPSGNGVDGPKPFVFPGSRSTARPKVSAKSGNPQIKLRGKRSKSRAGRPPNLDEQMLSPSSASAGGGSNSESQYSPSLDGRFPSSPGADTANRSLMGNSISSTEQSSQPSERARTVSSPSAVQSTPAKPAFVYPSGRTRAHPKTPPKAKVRTRKQSTESGTSEKDKSTKFLGITIKKKKKYPPLPTEQDSPLAHTLSTPSRENDENAARRSDRSESSDSPSYPSTSGSSQQTQSVNGSFRDNQPQEPPQPEPQRAIKTKIGSYPLDPYDSTLLDNDRQTGELLRRINPSNSPTYHDYGNFPPMSILDLGCGQGHWVLDAAITWKGFGTRVTGMDMVDISKTIRPWAIKHGVSENIRFIRGNFVKQRLPFPSEAFDLVRMSCLALCVPAERWEFVLQEVHRVLSPGGRLEFIDDHLFFPYGKAPVGSNNNSMTSLPQLQLPVPQLDIHIPNSSFSSFSICDPGNFNPGLGAYHDDDERADGDIYDLYGVQEEEDEDDAATLSGHNSLASYDTFGNPLARSRPGSYGGVFHSNGMTPATWNQQADTCRELESLFEDMMYHKYGIHMHPSEFILELLKHVFGFSRDIKAMHLTLAPPDTSPPASVAPSADGHDASYRHHVGRLTPLLPSGRSTISRSTGLILWPSTFIPMPNSEIEIHASKHLRTLLSCKNNLVEYTLESTDEEHLDEDSILEALWEYESFLRPRFTPPPGADVPSAHHAQEDSEPYQDNELYSDAQSIRESIFSVTSEGQDAMLEYQSELRGLFVSTNTNMSDSPRSSQAQAFSNPEKSASAPASANVTSASGVADGRRASGASGMSSVAPPYSRNELVHVRTFHVYEAIKMDAAVFGSGPGF